MSADIRAEGRPMNARRSLTVLIAAAGVATSLLLAGCEPATGQQDDASISGSCDPNGFGPFSGCGDKGTTEQATEPASSTDGCDPSGFGPFSGCGDTEQNTAIPDDGSSFERDSNVSAERMAIAARHESGHYWYAKDQGWSVISAKIRPDGSGAVYVFGLKLKPAQQQLAFYYAGAAAAGTEEGYWGTSEQKGDSDYAEDILDRYPVDEATRMEEAARAEASRVVASRSAEINRDAADLLEDGELG